MQRVIYMRRPRSDRDQRGLQQQLERVFQHQCGHPKSVIVIAQNQEVWHPPTDVYETDSAVVIKVELPGMRDSEIEVLLDERVLHIRGNRPEQRNEGLRYYHQMGINYGPFGLDVFLAHSVDHEQISANYDDGFLVIELSKSAANPVTTQIHIQTNEH